MPEQRRVRARYPARPSRVREARRQAACAARRWGLDAASSAALVLVVSELVTNAVTHARTPPGRQVEVTLTREEAAVRVAVRDADPTPPTPRRPTADAEGGRGLLLVAHLSRRWGVEQLVVGKTVWAEVPLTGAPPLPRPPGDGDRSASGAPG